MSVTSLRNQPLPSQNRIALPDAWVWFMIGSLLYSGLALIRLSTWRATVYDLGWYSQALWLIGHGHYLAPASMTGGPPLAQAESFILIPLSWIYRFSGQPGILVTQSLALASSVLPLGLMVQSRGLPRYWISLLALVYLTYPPILGSAVFDFHPDTFAVPIFFWALWAMQGGHWRTYAFMMLLAPLVKNYAAAITIVMALVPLYKKEWRWAIATTAWGSLVLFLDLHVVGHLFGKHLADWSGYYGYLGTTPSQALIALVRHPGVLFRQLFRPSHWPYYIVLLWPLGLVLPFYGLWTGTLWPALADITLNMLSLTPHHVYLSNPYNYSSDFAVAFLMVSTMQALPKRPHPRLHLALVGFLVFSSVFVGASAMHARLWPGHPPVAGFTAAAAHVPRNAPLYGEDITLARFPNRLRYYPVGKLAPQHPAAGAYLLLTTWRNVNGLTPAQIHRLLMSAQRNPAWHTVVHEDHVWLFEYGKRNN